MEATTAERTARMLAWATIGWNITEAVIALWAAKLANSPALLGFGLDSVVESLSSFIMVWRFQGLASARHREDRALRMVGGSLLMLALFVMYDATGALFSREIPDVSPIGIGLAIVSILLMPLLARWKRQVAVEIGSGALHADSRQTDICWYLAAILLAGIGLNATLGWWWADPVAALAMVPLVAYEASQALRGKSVCGSC